MRENRARYADRHDVAVHSLIRDHRAAEIATRRAIDLAVRHQHRFHVLHVSTAQEPPLFPSRGLGLRPKFALTICSLASMTIRGLAA